MTLDDLWLDAFGQEVERGLSEQSRRCNNFLLIATLLATATTALAGPVAIAASDGWERIATMGLGAMTLLLAAAVGLSADMYDSDPIDAIEAVVENGLTVGEFRTAVLSHKLLAFELSEKGLARTRVLLLTELLSGFAAVGLSVWLVGP